MTKIGIDLGKFKSNVCVMSGPDEVSEEFVVSTNEAAMTSRFAKVPPCQIAIEAGRSAAFVKRALEKVGHEVVVVDTSRVRHIGVGQGRRKNDRRDAEALARALFTGAVPRAELADAQTTRLRDSLNVRDSLVHTRSGFVTTVRGQFQAQGINLRSCAVEDFTALVRREGGELAGATAVVVVLRMIDELSSGIAALEEEQARLGAENEAFERLMTVPGVGPVTALWFIAILGRVERFRNAREVGAYFGLVPSEHSSGGKERRGRITKVGNRRARAVLVQAAWSMMLSKKHRGDPQVVWGRQVCDRRARKVGAVALARKLTGMLYAIWRDGTTYDASFEAKRSAAGLTRKRKQARRDEAQMLRVAQG